MPPWASGPVLMVKRPSLKGAACACTAGVFSAAMLAPVASIPLITDRLLIGIGVHSLADDCWSPLLAGDLCLETNGNTAARLAVGRNDSKIVASRQTPKSNTKIAMLDRVVGPQLLRGRGIDHLALAHDVDVVDELERQRGVLLDQQDREALALELADRLPQPLDDDGRQPLGWLIHDQ